MSKATCMQLIVGPYKGGNREPKKTDPKNEHQLRLAVISYLF